MSEINDEGPTRQEIRQALADPATTQEQKLRLKRVLLKRIASTPARIRKTIANFSPAIAAQMSERHLSQALIKRARQAEREAAKIETALKILKPDIES